LVSRMNLPKLDRISARCSLNAECNRANRTPKASDVPDLAAIAAAESAYYRAMDLLDTPTLSEKVHRLLDTEALGFALPQTHIQLGRILSRANPSWVAQQMGHVNAQMLFKVYSK
jgi:hypothetical protein